MGEDQNMFKRKIVTLTALALTGVIFLLSPLIQEKEDFTSAGHPILRIWILEEEPAVSRWLKQQAARYEKETGQRIYLRTASQPEITQALSGVENAIIPDLIIMQGLNTPLLYRGYALIVRDEGAVIQTPAPTSALFFRPTATPGPSPSPQPESDLTAFSPILAPPFLSTSLSNLQVSADPIAAFVAGKAPAALLTAGQATQLSFGYRAYALKNGEGMLPVQAAAMNNQGNAFLSFLQKESAQRALAGFGLYSFDPSIRLYDETDPIRSLIERSRK